MNTHATQPVFIFHTRELQDQVTFLMDGTIIAYKNRQGQITATRNRCRHQNGRFPIQSDCVLTCPNHGWKLDVSSMRYTDPKGDIAQAQLRVEAGADGLVRLFEDIVSIPWDQVFHPEEPLVPSELTVRFYAHACMEVTCGTKTLFTDPWLVGPAFSRGWWLVHEPPADWPEKLAGADAIYISHNHSDHLNLPTLKIIASKNPEVPIFIPRFESDSCRRLIESTGLRNVNVVPFNIWTQFGADGRFMLLQDDTGRDDSGILVEYRGHRLLNAVDCSNFNGGNLPTPVDMLLTSFASGETGYPICWSEQYSTQEIETKLEKNRATLRAMVVDTMLRSGAKCLVPFAGYFTEAHPADAEIRGINIKNTPFQIRDDIHQVAPDTAVWIPEPGSVFDLATMRAVFPSEPPLRQPIYDFDRYLDPIRNDASFEPLQVMDGIRRYFQWANFTGDLVLHVIETDEDFQATIREFLVDFSELSFPDKRPSRQRPYLRMRVRSDVFRHVLRWGLPWEEISIGFQARFYREPDVYNFDFWHHFQDLLPLEPPRWT